MVWYGNVQQISLKNIIELYTYHIEIIIRQQVSGFHRFLTEHPRDPAVDSRDPAVGPRYPADTPWDPMRDCAYRTPIQTSHR